MAPAGLYPREVARTTKSEAEKTLHRELSSQLPEGWAAWHSLRVRIDGEYEGEGDFVIAVPNRGILVLEVKGGVIGKDHGHWVQSGRRMDKAPRDQANQYMKGLIAKLEELSNQRRPRVEIACAFPETPETDKLTEGAVSGAVLGLRDLPYLREALSALVERLFRNAERPRGTHWINVLHDLWCETWTPKLSLGVKTEQREHELLALDTDQLKLLDSIHRNQRMLVFGGAGTGKTLVAREMYRRFARAGRRPLYFCYTNALAEGLRSWGIQDAWTVRQYAAELLERAGIEMQGGMPTSQWSSETWDLAPLQAATDALPKLELPYDAVIVDEGQDLASDDWDLVETIAQGHALWVFADEAQGFWEERGVRQELFPAIYELVNRYRCPEPLAQFADRYAGKDENVAADDGEGGSGEQLELPIEELRLVKVPSQSAVPNKVAVEIQKALGDGVRPSDIAVITLGGQVKTGLGTADKIGSYPVVRADDPRAADHIVADTFLRFKGLERPLIIVTEVYLGKTRYDVRMHVALTRATVRCVVVATAEQIEKDERLQQALGK